MLGWKEIEKYKTALLKLQTQLKDCNKRLEEAYNRINDLEKTVEEQRLEIAEAYRIIAQEELINRKLVKLMNEFNIPEDRIEEINNLRKQELAKEFEAAIDENKEEKKSKKKIILNPEKKDEGLLKIYKEYKSEKGHKFSSNLFRK